MNVEETIRIIKLSNIMNLHDITTKLLFITISNTTNSNNSNQIFWRNTSSFTRDIASIQQYSSTHSIHTTFMFSQIMVSSSSESSRMITVLSSWVLLMSFGSLSPRLPDSLVAWVTTISFTGKECSSTLSASLTGD